MKSSLLCLAIVLTCCGAYKILLVFPVPGKSHSILGDGYVKHLLKGGHEVTYITPYSYKSTSPNLRVIDVSSNIQLVPTGFVNISSVINKEIPSLSHRVIWPLFHAIAKLTLENENVQKLLLNPNEQFDVVISEWMFSSLPSSYAAVFNCPLIWSSSMDTHWSVLRLVDQISNPAYTADAMSEFLPPFTFWQRITELYNQLEVLYTRYMYIEELEKKTYKDVVTPIITNRGHQVPSYADVQFNGSLLLVNSHISVGQAGSIPQSVKAVGGYHIEEEVKPLPENLKKIMDNAKNGVIYFSMGTNLNSKDIPKELKESLLNMFGELKQTVLWKFEEDLPGVPKNVHILKWAPQQSVLSHPNLVLFITHGGILSTMETIHFGVPVIGIPVFADQFTNVARSVQRGYALKVDLSLDMAGNLKNAIDEMTSTKKYTDKAKELSMIYHDRLLTPGKELVYWVEHVARTHGALHLRSPALHVPFYQKLYLDLLVFILITLFVLLKLLMFAYGLIRAKNRIDKKKVL